MMTEKYNIKGMICSRCLKVLNNELKASGAEVMDIQLGSIQIKYDPEKLSRAAIEKIIHENEFDILWDEDSIIAERTKRWIINYVWNADHTQNLSEFLIEKMNKSYHVLSRNFSKIFGKTIERYSTMLKIERIKELIEYGEMSFSEMAYALGYQNPSALSRQFKKETGMTMKTYKNLDKNQRIPLDKILKPKL